MAITTDRITRFTKFLRRHGKPVLAATAVLAILSIVGLFRLKIETDFTVFMPSDSVHMKAMHRIADSFGDADQLIVITETRADNLSHLPSLEEKLADIDGIMDAESPLPGADASMDEEELARLAERMDRFSGTSVLNEYDSTTWSVLRLLYAPDADLRAVLHEVRAVLDAGGGRYFLSGEPYLEATVFDYIFRILLTLPPAAILLMLGVFRFRIGSVRATALSMIPAALGSLLTLGAVSWLSGGVSIVTVLVPIFIIVLGSADGLHLTSHVLDDLESGAEPQEAVRNTLAAVGGAIIMTTVTTMAGFLSLLLINSPAIREMAVTAAGGILVAGAATWFIVPAVLLRMKPPARKRRRTRGRAEGFLGGLIGLPSIVLAGILLAASIPGLFRLQANFSMIDVYKPSTEVRKSIDAVTRIMGGSIPVYLAFDAAEPFNGKTAEAILEFEKRARERGIIGSGISAYGIVAAASETLTGRPGYPTNRLFAERAAGLVSRFNPSFTDSFFSDNGLGRAVFFLTDLDDSTVKAFVDTAAQVSEETGIPLECAGTAFVMQEMNSQILPQQFASLLLAAAVVLVIVTLTQKSLGLGIITTVPILITLAVLFGVMGYARLDVSVITGIMSGLTVGVGIDYAIHYTAMYRRAAAGGAADPRKEALSYVATPVTANAAGLAVGFTALSFSPLSIHVTLSVLMWVTMISSAFLSLTLLPSLAGLRRNPPRPG